MTKTNNDIPLVAFSNAELDAKKPIGKSVTCNFCKKRHKVTYGKDLNGKIDKIVGITKCKNGEWHLVSIVGKRI